MYQVFNLKLKSTAAISGGKLAQHVVGDIRPKTAKPREGLESILLIDQAGRPLAERAREQLVAERAREQSENVDDDVAERAREQPENVDDDVAERAREQPENVDDDVAERARDVAEHDIAERVRQLDRQAVDEAKEFIKECRKRSRRVRGPKTKNPVAFFMIAGLPRYGEVELWKEWIPNASNLSLADLRSEQNRVTLKYTTAALQFIQQRGGPNMRFVRCAIHQDEAAPHAHAHYVMADADYRLGWNRVGQGFGVDKGAPVPERRSLKALSASELLRQMQTQFNLDVGSKFGLERGGKEGGSTRQPIDREKGIELRLQEDNRHWQKYSDDIAKERNAARAELQRTKQERATVLKERDAARTDLQSVTAERDTARAELQRTKQERATVLKERDAARTDLQSVTAERNAARAELQRTKQERATVLKERDAARTDLQSVTAERDTVRAECDEAVTGWRRSHADAEAATRERDTARTMVAKVTEERDTARGNLGVVEKKLEAAHATLAEVTSERDALRAGAAGVELLRAQIEKTGRRLEAGEESPERSSVPDLDAGSDRGRAKSGPGRSW